MSAENRQPRSERRARIEGIIDRVVWLPPAVLFEAMAVGEMVSEPPTLGRLAVGTWLTVTAAVSVYAALEPSAGQQG